jgi:hypothetical protein
LYVDEGVPALLVDSLPIGDDTRLQVVLVQREGKALVSRRGLDTRNGLNTLNRLAVKEGRLLDAVVA